MSDYTKIACLLLIGVVLYMSGKAFASWLARRDADWAEKNPPLFPPELNDTGPVPPVSARDKEIAAEHVTKRIPAMQSRLSKREMKAAFHGDPGGWKGIADAAVRKAYEDATQSYDWQRSPAGCDTSRTG